MPTVKALAEEARQQFEKRQRDNGDNYWITKEPRPEWLDELIHKAHGDMLPDDYCYAFIVEALDVLAESDNEDGEDEYLEPDIYSNELLTWLASALSRMEYCDRWASESGLGEAPSLFDMLQGGQAMEKNEVLESVRWSLFELTREAMVTADAAD